MQALAERLADVLCRAQLERVELLGFTGLKTVSPRPEELLGRHVEEVGRRAKYLLVTFEGGTRLAVHLSQAGRVDIERPPKSTRPRGGVVRLVFSNDLAVVVREHGSERKARWWVLAPGDEGPLAGLGPEPFDEAYAEMIASSEDARRVHTVLRDQHTVAGIGRGYADDIVHRAKLSPFSSLRGLDEAGRAELVAATRAVLTEALERERTRSGGLSEARLGERFAVHNRAAQPCPQCGRPLARVSYEAYEVVYCPRCQTKGKVLADRRLSRLLR
jgi:formamidopyrimidine-DNA glycosylase